MTYIHIYLFIFNLSKNIYKYLFKFNFSFPNSVRKNWSLLTFEQSPANLKIIYDKALILKLKSHLFLFPLFRDKAFLSFSMYIYTYIYYKCWSGLTERRSDYKKKNLESDGDKKRKILYPKRFFNNGNKMKIYNSFIHLFIYSFIQKFHFFSASSDYVMIGILLCCGRDTFNSLLFENSRLFPFDILVSATHSSLCSPLYFLFLFSFFLIW